FFYIIEFAANLYPNAGLARVAITSHSVMEWRPPEIQRLASKFIERPERDDQILVMSHPRMYVERFFEYVEYSSLLAWMANSWLDGTLIHWWAIYLYGCAERRFAGHNKCAILNPSLMHWRMCRENNAVAFVFAVSFASNRLSLLSLPSSPWLWRWPSSSSTFSISSAPTPPPLLLNPKTALYSMFHCESDACKKQNGKMNNEVSKMIKKLKDETLLRRKMKTRDEKLEKVEAELRRARVLIRGVVGTNHSRSSSSFDDPDYVPSGSIYRNPEMFHRTGLRAGIKSAI
nr:probable glycosyltransferase At3g07620 [Tanacetum cinerariifolium]